MTPLRRSLVDPLDLRRTVVRPGILYIDDLEIILDAFEEASKKVHKDFEAERRGRLSRLTEEQRTVYTELSKKLTQNDEDDEETKDRKNAISTCVIVRAGAAQADTADDLRDARPEELADLTVAVEHPKVICHLGKRFASIAADAADPEALALADQISAYLRKRRSIVAVIATAPKALFWIPAIATVFVVAAICISPDKWTRADEIALAVTFGFMLIFPAAAVIFFSLRFGGVIVRASRRSEARGLTAQTRRNLLIGSIAALSGAALTTLGAIIIASRR